MSNVFTPNWKRLGIKSKEEGIQRAKAFLLLEKKTLIKKGIGEDVTFILDGKHFILTSKGFEESK